MWPFSYERTRKSIESDLNDLMKRGDSVDLEELKELAEKNPTTKYINFLVLDLCKAKLDELLLRSSSPMPRVELVHGTKMPTFAKVVNRLKIMTNLYAVICRPPREGKIELTVHGRDAVLHVRFDDTAPDCSVHLRLEWLDEPSPPTRLG